MPTFEYPNDVRIIGYGPAGTGQPDVIAALAAQAYTVNRLAVDSVIRGDDGATYSAVRTTNGVTGLGSTLVRLMTDAVVRGVDPNNSNNLAPIQMHTDISTAAPGALNVEEARKSGFYTSRQGRRYVITGSNAGTIAGAVGLTTTTPSFLIVPGSTKEVIVRRIIATLVTPGTATSSQMVIKTDTANRFSAGGTARAPATTNQGNTVATGLAQNLELPTATAEGGGTIQVASRGGGIIAGQPIIYEPEDGLIIASSGSLLVYLVNATGAANYCYEIEFEEANCQ